ncbi:MAG: BadF/BadG/BcrA/BcrD ATPase family protein [Candidatus Latescibacterota bacterium]
MYAAGIDGGGTRTRAVLVAPDGRIRARGTAGCGNFQSIGASGLEDVVGGLLGTLWAGGPAQPLSLCLALAGVGREDDREEVAALARRCGWAQELCVVSDARAALEGAHAAGAGLVVVAGTGSIVLGKGPGGEEARAGGWGPVLGDEGSGYALAAEALRAALRAHDGWGPPTALEEVLRGWLGLQTWEEAVRRVYGGDLGRDRIAALAPAVLETARRGDAVAAALVWRAGHALGQQVAAVARRLGLERGADLAGAGGLLEAADLWPSLEEAARQAGVQVRRRASLLPPVLGAVLMAWQATGRPVDRQLVQGLAADLPAGAQGTAT